MVKPVFGEWQGAEFFLHREEKLNVESRPGCKTKSPKLSFASLSKDMPSFS